MQSRVASVVRFRAQSSLKTQRKVQFRGQSSIDINPINQFVQSIIQSHLHPTPMFSSKFGAEFTPVKSILFSTEAFLVQLRI